MKQIVFLWAQTICLAGAFAQPQLAPAGRISPTGPGGSLGSAVRGGAVPVQDSPAQRRNELRAILQSQHNALEQPTAERRLSPEERAELREQVRQQFQGTPQIGDKP